MCITEATTALTLRVYALISICRPSCPSMVAHGVRTMKRSHLPPRPANTLPDPHRKSGVWADVAPQCEPSCQTASILQTRSNPSRSTFPPSSWTPPPPPPPPYSSTPNFYPTLPFFSLVFPTSSSTSAVSRLVSFIPFPLALPCSLRRPLFVLRSSFIVGRRCTRTARVPRTRGRSTTHYRTWSIRARRSSSSSSSSLLPACRRGVVADQRPPGVPTCSVRTRSRGRMHTQPYSRWRWCSATSATTKVRDLSLLAVTWLRYSLLLDRGRFTFPREGICSSSLKFDELAQLAYRATV